MNKTRVYELSKVANKALTLLRTFENVNYAIRLLQKHKKNKLGVYYHFNIYLENEQKRDIGSQISIRIPINLIQDKLIELFKLLKIESKRQLDEME